MLGRMAKTKFKRGDVVLRPDAWAPRGGRKLRKGRAIVVKAWANRVMLCTFHPGRKVSPAGDNPHIGHYLNTGLVQVGRVKKMPKACGDVLKWKADFYKRYPFFARPTLLKARG